MSGTPQVDADCLVSCSSARRPSTTCTMRAGRNSRLWSTSSSSRVGGDRGAFGAGFLKGWQKVPGQHPLAKPEFDAVTGVSPGTLIAPFAFVGDAKSIGPDREPVS